MNITLRKKRVDIRGRIKQELDSPKPNLENIIKIVQDYEKDNIRFIDKLKKEKSYDAKRISGALKQTIHAHGAITPVFIGSATKRILGSLLENHARNDNEVKFSKGTLNLIICGLVVVIALTLILM